MGQWEQRIQLLFFFLNPPFSLFHSCPLHLNRLSFLPFLLLDVPFFCLITCSRASQENCRKGMVGSIWSNRIKPNTPVKSYLRYRKQDNGGTSGNSGRTIKHPLPFRWLMLYNSVSPSLHFM